MYCKTCKWYNRGWCHRYPPTVTPSDAIGEVMMSRVSVEENDYCGEYKEKSASSGQASDCLITSEMATKIYEELGLEALERFLETSIRSAVKRHKNASPVIKALLSYRNQLEKLTGIKGIKDVDANGNAVME